jgi:catechol 2,3-dioxygenase-like lactoylglutathione lyase family enzyme
MHVKGIAWLGTRTDRLEEMVRFAVDVLGLSGVHEREHDAAVFDLPNGDSFEIFGPNDTEHRFMTGPMGEFLVDDVEKARMEMERKGVTFIGPVHRASDGNAWAHFRAPDGHVYGITSGPVWTRSVLRAGS